MTKIDYTKYGFRDENDYIAFLTTNTFKYMDEVRKEEILAIPRQKPKKRKSTSTK